MGMRFVPAIIACVLSLSVHLLPQSKELDRGPDWKTYTYEQDDFSMEAPKPPNKHQDTQVAQMTAYLLLLENGTALTVRVGPRPPNCTAVLQRLRDALNNTGPEKVLIPSLRDIRDGNAGFEYSSTWGMQSRHTRYECGPGRLYFVIGSWHGGQEMPSQLARVFRSFRVLSASPRK
jgi:hypothetical protein